MVTLLSWFLMMGEMIFPLTILIDGWGARQLASETKIGWMFYLTSGKQGLGWKMPKLEHESYTDPKNVKAFIIDSLDIVDQREG